MAKAKSPEQKAQDAEKAKARREAKKAAEAAAAAQSPSQGQVQKASADPAAPAAPGKVKVKSLVNMILPDYSRLIVGEVCEISKEEHARLSEDARGPFWE